MKSMEKVAAAAFPSASLLALTGQQSLYYVRDSEVPERRKKA